MTKRDELEEFYSKPDPWGYKNRADDIIRRKYILEAIPDRFYRTTLDIGCGEGFITQELPGQLIHGVDISQKAIDRAARRHNTIYSQADVNIDYFGTYDLVVATGVLYPHYVNEQTIHKVLNTAKKILVTCHAREIGKVDIPYDPISHMSFEYDSMTQDLEVYDLFAARKVSSFE